MARILIGYSSCALTRAAFEAQGHDVYTCDLLPARDASSKHFQCDIWQALDQDWDFSVLHPMCTVMTTAGAWAFNDPDFSRYPGVGYHQAVNSSTLVGSARRLQQQIEFRNFRRLLQLPFPVAIENPARSMISTSIRRPDQVIHPYMFGDDASKATALWLSPGVPHLVHSAYSEHSLGRLVEWPKASRRLVRRYANQTDSGQNNVAPGADRWLARSMTYPGIANAMGEQWGSWLNGSLNFATPSQAVLEF